MTAKKFSDDEIIDMAWCDKTSFDDIHAITGLCEKQVMKIMKANIKPKAYQIWRKRVHDKFVNKRQRHKILEKAQLMAEN